LGPFVVRIGGRIESVRKRVLYHLHTTPIPVDGGDRARISGIMNYFKERRSSLAVDAFASENCNGWGVTYGLRAPKLWRPEIVDFVLESAEHFFVHERKRNLGEYMYVQAALRYYYRIRKEILPTDSEVAVSRSYASFVRRIAKRECYDYIWINFIDYARVGLVALPKRTQRVIDIHDLASAARHSKKDLPEFRGLKFDFDRNLAREVKVLDKFDKISVNSTEELDAIGHHIANEKLYLVPHVVEPSGPGESVPSYGSREFRYDLVYVGSDQSWNVKAINTFLAGALPEIVRKVPCLRVAIVGKVGSFTQVAGALRQNVDALGVIPSMAEAYLASKVVICPLLEGAGTKLKLSEAIYYQVPIVTTSVGASGLLLRDGVNCLIRDRQEDFAAGVIHLLREPEEAMRMSKELGRLYEKEYSRSVIFKRLDQLFGIA
jgi:glycosyltransferase involved in cell wall biosynthesis